MADQVSDLLNSKQLTRGNVFAFLALFVCKLLKINKLLVEAAGVEPDISVENTQLTDSGNTSNSSNATIAKSSVQITYKDLPELQNFQAPPTLAQHAEVLFYIYTSIMCRQNDCTVELQRGIHGCSCGEFQKHHLECAFNPLRQFSIIALAFVCCDCV
ncbi:MAG: hypothetical protein ABSG96_25440 [Terracidiphilus sp.]